MSLQLDTQALHQERAADDNLMSGRQLKAEMLRQLAMATQILRHTHQVIPCLAVVQIGDHPASNVYVRHKINACKKTGIKSLLHHLPESTTEAELSTLLDELNQDDSVHGILVQLPLPAQIDPQAAILRVNPDKDVDGYHPANLGYLMAWRGTLEPCTPRGIMTLCRAYGVGLEGVHAVVVGRSMTVGRPMAQMLMRANATVTVCHRYTYDLAEKVAQADVLVVATGVPRLIKGAWIKPGATVIDVGITRQEDGSLCGDVEFDVARERAGLITPVPGGVGQMTVATLLENTVRAACKGAGVHIDLATQD